MLELVPPANKFYEKFSGHAPAQTAKEVVTLDRQNLYIKLEMLRTTKS